MAAPPGPLPLLPDPCPTGPALHSGLNRMSLPVSQRAWFQPQTRHRFPSRQRGAGEGRRSSPGSHPGGRGRVAPMLAPEKGREGTSRLPVAIRWAETQGPPQAQSPREAAKGEGHPPCQRSTEGSGFKQRGKQAETSAPSGSSPTCRPARPRPRPGRVVPAENQGAIHSCCLQSPGLQGHGQAPRLCLHSNATSHPHPPPRKPDPELFPHPQEAGGLPTHPTYTPPLRRGSHIFNLQQPSSTFISSSFCLKALGYLLRSLAHSTEVSARVCL